MALTDYHMHSSFSPDGRDQPATLCQQALDLGLAEIAITDHAEWCRDWEPGLPRANAYFAAINECRARFGPQGLTVYAGVELGNPHEHLTEATALVAAYPFDVVLASLHWLRGESIHLEWCFADRSPTEVYAEYFTELRRMVTRFDCDVVAHFDRILWRGTLMGASFDPFEMEPIVRGTLTTIAELGRALELNTKFLAHTPGWNEALVVMLRWFRAAGGSSIVLGSDAHCAQDIACNMDIAQRLLGEAGVSVDARLRSRAFS